MYKIRSSAEIRNRALGGPGAGPNNSEGPTLAWYRDALNADWSKPSDVKAQFATASILQDGRVVFNIGGNKYRVLNEEDRLPAASGYRTVSQRAGDASLMGRQPLLRVPTICGHL